MDAAPQRRLTLVSSQRIVGSGKRRRVSYEEARRRVAELREPPPHLAYLGRSHD